jgi:hypothetical protein
VNPRALEVREGVAKAARRRTACRCSRHFSGIFAFGRAIFVGRAIFADAWTIAACSSIDRPSSLVSS